MEVEEEEVAVAMRRLPCELRSTCPDSTLSWIIWSSSCVISSTLRRRVCCEVRRLEGREPLVRAPCDVDAVVVGVEVADACVVAGGLVGEVGVGASLLLG